MLNVGILGTGAIGSNVTEQLRDGAVQDTRVTCIYNRTPERARSLVSSLGADREITVASNPQELSERADVVVEAASQRAVEESAIDILETGTDLVIMSVGAFRDRTILQRVRTTAREHEARVRVPSGAIAGLDGVAATANAPLEEITLVHNRTPEYLEPYLDDGTTPDDLADGDIVFEGTAAEAAASFPSHQNIAIALTLAAKAEPEEVTVRIVTDMDAPRSRNVVRARSSAGDISVEIRNFESPTHETSSLITASVIETLRRMSDAVVVGT